MRFAHANMTGVLLAADLVNGSTSSDGELEELLRDHDIRKPMIDQGQAGELRAWALQVRGVFAAPDARARVATVNALLAQGAGGVYLTMHDGLPPHLHFTPEHDDVVARVRAVTSGGLAVFAVESEGERLGVCARVGCGLVFVDTSRNGRRAYCSARCGNTVAVARHRQHPRNG
jgi:predicted RNA-binding Zn ribbon-like protein